MSDWPQTSQRTDDIEIGDEQLFARSGSPYWHDKDGKAVAWRDDNAQEAVYGEQGSIWDEFTEATMLPPSQWKTTQQRSIDELKESLSGRELLEQAGIEYKETASGKGTKFRFCCPFHDDTNPSCDYWPEIQAFKCWSCGSKGDIIELYWRLTNNGAL